MKVSGPKLLLLIVPLLVLALSAGCTRQLQPVPSSVPMPQPASSLASRFADAFKMELIRVTPPPRTVLRRGSTVTFVVTVTYEISWEGAADMEFGAELGLPNGKSVYIDRVQVNPAVGTTTVRAQIDVGQLYAHLQADTAYLILNLGYWITGRASAISLGTYA